MRVRCTTIITFRSVLFPFPVIISKTYYSSLALHANKWLTMIGWSLYAHHVNGWATSLFCQWMVYARHVSDFGLTGFLGVVLLASCSVYFGYTECVPCIGLHFPPECVPSIGFHLPRIQSNDLSYTVSVCHVSNPTICPTWSKQMSYSVTFYHIYVFIVGFPAIIPTSSILRAVYADLL